MKILGVSLGTKNGNNDTMCRVALEEAQKMGAEIEFTTCLTGTSRLAPAAWHVPEVW